VPGADAWGTLQSQLGGFVVYGYVPLRCGNSCAGCLSTGDTSLGHHIVSRIKVFTVLDVSSGSTK